MQKRIDELKSSFNLALSEAYSAEALENLRVEYLGKKGHIAELMKEKGIIKDVKEFIAYLNTHSFGFDFEKQIPAVKKPDFVPCARRTFFL